MFPQNDHRLRGVCPPGIVLREHFSMPGSRIRIRIPFTSFASKSIYPCRPAKDSRDIGDQYVFVLVISGRLSTTFPFASFTSQLTVTR